MNDTHGVEGKPWTGFDLDGTLAVYDKWEGIDHIGEPVKPMVDLMKKMHADGEVVKILTARVAPRSQPEEPVVNVYHGRPEPWTRDAFMNMFDRKVDAMAFAGMYSAETWGPREFVIDWCVNYLGFVPEITHEKDHLMVNLYDDRVTEVVTNQGITVQQRYDCARKCVDYWRMKYNGGSLKYLAFLLGLGIGFVGAFLLFFCCVTSTRDVPRDAAYRLHKASEELMQAIDNYNASCTTNRLGPIVIPPKEDKE